VATYRTFGSVDVTGLIDEEVINALPKSVKFICHNGMAFLYGRFMWCESEDARLMIGNRSWL
jgi:hypothetical protein